MPPESETCRAVDELCQNGSLIDRCEQYVHFCLSEENEPRKRPRLPNAAGFFRWLELDADALRYLKQNYPEKFRTIQMIFEDEALNSPLPPSIVSAYLKQYFPQEEEPESSRAECGPITVLFDHDINCDGR
ncbi:MAG: hypothetical protein MSA49_05170 [Clostridia bacterium]|nr:hypothetical protein [Clostridia bacterium]